MTVAAVVTGPPAALARCRAALAAQTVEVGFDLPSADHVWFLHGAAVPEPDALERLLAAPAAPVVAGLVVGAGGAPCPATVPQVAEREPLVMVDTVGDGLLPIRYATFAHTLVSVEAMHAPPLPARGRYAAARWTARALAGRRGWWATRSVAVAEVCPPFARASLRDKLAMTISRTWTPVEAIEELSGIERNQGPHGGSAPV